MKTKKNYAVIFGMLWILTFMGCGQPVSNEKKQEPTIGGASLETLAKDSIQVTLWTESKESFELIIKDTLSQSGVLQTSFALDMRMFQSAFEFEWIHVKDYMRWQGCNRDIFHDKQKNDFVVIGSYNTSDPWILRFYGYVYAYKKHNK